MPRKSRIGNGGDWYIPIMETISTPTTRFPAAVEETLARLPAEPGCYLFKDAAGVVLYVGKARSLRDRVRSYFRNPGGLSLKNRGLVPRIAEIDYQILPSENAALLVECNLIKQYRPRYNILLRDDKSYIMPFASPTSPILASKNGAPALGRWGALLRTLHQFAIRLPHPGSSHAFVRLSLMQAEYRALPGRYGGRDRRQAPHRPEWVAAPNAPPERTPSPGAHVNRGK